MKRFLIMSILILLNSCVLFPMDANGNSNSLDPYIAQKSITSNNPFETNDLDYKEKLSGFIKQESDIKLESRDSKKERDNELKPKKNQYIIKFKENVSFEEIYTTISSLKYKVIGESKNRLFKIQTESDSTSLLSNSFVEWIEKDSVRKLNTIPNDPYIYDQWAINELSLPDAWNITKGSYNVKVAVIDSGVNKGHPDLLNSRILNGWDIIFDEPVSWDSIGHGTAVTGVMAAGTNNGKGMAGTDWYVSVVPFRVVYSSGEIYVSDVIEATYLAADTGCKVINLSLGGSDYSPGEDAAIQYAVSKGCIVVAAAGNDGNSVMNYPASYDNVISVASIGPGSLHSSFSNYNTKIDVSAPGEYVLTTTDYNYLGFNYGYVDGTSFSAPYVSGIAGLAAACNPLITPEEFNNAIKESSTDLGTPGYDDYYGYGRINAQNLLKKVVYPAVPTGFQVDLETDKQVILSWDNNLEGDRAGYQLEYKKTTGATTWTVVSIAKDITSKTITGLTNEIEYTFRIKAKDTLSNWSEYTEPITAIPSDNMPPLTPSGFKVSSVNDGKIVLNWTAVTALDLSGYKIEYKKADEIDWSEVSVGKVITYTLSGLTNGDEYSLRISSKDTSGNFSEPSAEITGTPADKTAPAIPTGLKATSGSYLNVTLTWTGNTEADLAGYEVAYLKYGTTAWITVPLGAGSESTTVSGLDKATYSFKIRAIDTPGNYSAYSSVVSVAAKDLEAPAVPTGLTTTSQAQTIIVTWDNNTETDRAGFQLEYKKATGATTWTVVSIAKDITSKTISNLLNGTEYLFRIKAKDTSLNWSVYSNTMTGTPRDSVNPTAPVGFKVSSVNDGKIVLNWTAVTALDLSGYKIEYKKTDEIDWSEVGIGKVITYTLNGLTNEEEYSLRISSKDTSGNFSEPSAEITGSPADKTAPAIPTGLKAISGSYLNVTLTWNANTEADLAGYEVAYLKYGTTAWITVPLGAGSESTTVSELEKATYSFKIRANDTAGNYSAYSSVVSVASKDLEAPAVPTGLTTTGQAQTIIVTWDNNTESDRAGFQLEYKKAIGATTWTVVSIAKDITSKTISNLLNGTEYLFRIKAKDTSLNWSVYSNTMTGTPRDSVNPTAPIGLKVSSVNDGKIVLNWIAVTALDLSGYKIEYKKTDEIDWSEVTVGKVITYTLSGLTNGDEYSLRISSKDTSGNFSEPSAEIKDTPADKTAPAIPTGLKATSGSYLNVTLTWTGNTEADLAGYEVAYRKYGTTAWTTVPLGADSESTLITGLVKGASYSFKIRSKDLIGNYSTFSPVVSAIAKDLAPAVPSGLTTVSGNQMIDLTWNANIDPDLAGYQLEYKSALVTSWTIVSIAANDTSKTISGLTNGKTYQFRIKTKDAAGNWSFYSGIVNGVPGI